MKKLFVYGALMAKHKDKSSSYPVYLNNHQISFKVKGFMPFEPSFANLEESINKKAYGVIIILSNDDLNKYIAHESSYSTKTVHVVDNNNNIHECTALFLNRVGYSENVMPSARYARLLHLGARYHGLPQDITKYYKSLQKQGSKFTLYLRFLLPLAWKLNPIIGRKTSFYGVLLGLPTLVLVFIVILIYLFIK
ncbi:MAG TPA: hypothetical protein PKD00_04560 [Burkholderiales bacterium]|nr:hypothetical protein [Burkholderiales bacterium]